MRLKEYQDESKLGRIRTVNAPSVYNLMFVGCHLRGHVERFAQQALLANWRPSFRKEIPGKWEKTKPKGEALRKGYLS